MEKDTLVAAPWAVRTKPWVWTWRMDKCQCNDKAPWSLHTHIGIYVSQVPLAHIGSSTKFSNSTAGRLNCLIALHAVLFFQVSCLGFQLVVGNP